jgi:hypothetical protein
MLAIRRGIISRSLAPVKLRDVGANVQSWSAQAPVNKLPLHTDQLRPVEQQP